ncbi:MAG: prephenate dehydratase domain-containing protein [Enhygromyxa sp.]
MDMWSNPGDPSRDELLGASLARLRSEIDRLDAELLEGFLARLELAGQIGVIKQALGLAVADPEREREVLEGAIEQAANRCPPALVEALITQLIHAARMVQGRPRVAFLGPATTHSHRAVLRWFADAQLCATSTLRAVVEAVRSGEADYAVVPWSNRHIGLVAEVHEALRAAGPDLRVLCFAELSVRHVLAARSAPIERVFCRPEPLAGARRWLARELPGVAIELVSSNDEAARRAAACPGAAAITTTAAARVFGLEQVAEGIDGDDNRTIFALLCRADGARVALEELAGEGRAIGRALPDFVGEARAVNRAVEELERRSG